VKFCISALLLLALVSACTSFKSADRESTQVGISGLSVGDTVQIVTADETRVRFTIEAIDDDALIGDSIRIEKKDIRVVSVERIDPGKTAVAGITVFGVVACIGLIVLVVAL
jgi:hypothetical protein